MPILEQVLEQYPGEVKVVFKNFPLRSHRFALQAATAALAAGSLGKFWEFHDLLFENYNQLNDQKIRDISRSLGFDEVEFEKKMKDPAVQGQIRQDVLDGRQAGVRSTPTVFINGRLLRDRTLQGFQAAVEKELQKRGKTPAKPAS
ncbi:MAG: thioredoxin domain-containing protein [Desulfobacterales bacterium]|nr:MAG: thioredoxin domain-containing protein [Desulfobacterales bacterium]